MNNKTLNTLQWILGKQLNAEAVFTDKFVKNLHKRMFGDVWAWAGDFRNTNKNSGMDKWQIPIALKALCDDALFWIHKDTFSPDEVAIRFKHKIVSIHCFPNGNGRHSRLMADIIINKVYKQPMFSWAMSDSEDVGDAGTRYLNAVKAADLGKFEQLLLFSRS